MSKEIDKIVANIKKKFGSDSIMTLGDDKLNMKLERVSTGCKQIDDMLEGGVPKGRIIEIFGTESSGKTTLCLHIIKEVQDRNGIAAFIDAEHALDINYACQIGVKLDSLIINQPENGERALDIMLELISTEKVALIVVDSVAALTPKAEIEGDMEDQHIGRQARMMGQAMRKLTHLVKKTNTIVIFINQVRDKIGVMFGEKTTTPGGRALKFFAHLRLALTKIRTIKVKNEKKKNEIKAVVKKSKISKPFRQCEFVIEYGKGIVEE